MGRTRGDLRRCPDTRHSPKGARSMPRTTIIIFAALVLAAAIFGVTQHLSTEPQAETYTAAEVATRIKAEKTELKAEMAAAGTPYEPGCLPNDWAHAQRAYPYDRLNHDEIREAMLDVQARRIASRGETRVAWQERGPSNIGARVTDLAIHPTNPNIIYAAMASGGVFKSTDAGASWDPIFDDQPVQSIGAIALDPQDPNTIYVGTGEANSSSYSWSGMGVFRSTDAGSTWEHLGLDETRYIGRVLVDTHNADRIWVAAAGVLFGTSPDRGVYRTEDGGTTWDQVLAVSDSTAAIDLAYDPAHPDTLYAAMWERVRRLNSRKSGGWTSGIHKSTDGGDTWVELTNGLPSGADVGRIGVSVCESSPNVVYAFYCDDPGYFMGVYKSTNYGATWTQTNDGALSNLTSSFGWYFGQIRVDPTDPDRVFAMGVPLYRTTNGGASWSEVASANHVDHHAMVFDPSNPTHIYEGNDGGIYFSDSAGDTWSKLYDQPTNQFYAIEIDYLDPSRLYGGTQDNGTLRTATGGVDDWERIFGGDGFYTIVDPTDSDIIYCEYQYGNLYKSTDFGYNWYWGLNGVGNERTNWSMPVVMDPSDHETLYLGTYRVYRTTNGADSWNPISGDLTDAAPGASYGTVTTIAVAPSNPNVIWAGTDDSNVWMSDDGGTNWTKVSGSLPNRWVTRVAIDPTDCTTAYVTFSGMRWDEAISRVYRTEDSGATWTAIDDGLPNAAVSVIAIDPDMPSFLYVGTDLGCYYSRDTGATWDMLGSGLPPVPVYDIKIHQPTRTLVAGTHGRSMHSIDLDEITGVEEPVTHGKLIAELAGSPNPFNPTTTVRFTLAGPASVRLTVYDIAGRAVRTLADSPRTAGSHTVAWDGTASDGRPLGSGVYFLMLEAGDEVETAKVSLVK